MVRTRPPRRNSNRKNGNTRSIRQRVFSLPDQNPLLTAKPLCKLLGLHYRDYRNYVTKLRYRWKHYHRNERGSKCSTVHAWRGWCSVPAGLDRAAAVGAGWRLTKARNRWLLWTDRLGRLSWFETNRVNLYVRTPANLGKAYQLVCNGFSFTGLITDMKILEQVLESVRFKGAHFVFDAKARLPYLVIDLFRKSNGVIIKVGDRTHPTGVEVIAEYMDWAERNERLGEQLLDALNRLARSNRRPESAEESRFVV